MKIPHPVKMNDWGIRRFLVVMLAWQLVYWAFTLSNVSGPGLSFLRYLAVLTYLLFVPGIIILRIFRLHKLSTIETMLYSLGFSIFFIMITGLAINMALPPLGVENPINLRVLSTVIGTLVLVLLIISFLRDRSYGDSESALLSRILEPQVLLLTMLPLISIIGTYLDYYHQTNLGLMVLIGLIALVMVLIGLRRFFCYEHYAWAIFTIALAMLFFRTTLTSQLVGFDIHEEYYIANRTVQMALWTPNYSFVLNNMLSVTMLAPILNIMSDLSLIWLYKMVYPVLFAFVPLAMYHIVRRQSSYRIAMLASLFFIAAYSFYTQLPAIMRQQIGMLYFIILGLVMIDTRFSVRQRLIINVIFTLSLIFSHYGITFIYIFILTATWLTLLIIGQPEIRNTLFRIRTWLERVFDIQSGPDFSPAVEHPKTIDPLHVLWIIGIAFIWYFLTSNGTIVDRYGAVVVRIIHNLTSAFLNPHYSEGLRIVTPGNQTGFLRIFNLGINYLTQLLIIFGMAVVLVKSRVMHFTREHVAFMFFSLCLLGADVLIPYLSLTAPLERVYHITLLFLAPVFIIGLCAALGIIGGFLARLGKRIGLLVRSRNTALVVAACYLAVFFLFQTGFIWELAYGHSTSISLSLNWIKRQGTAIEKAQLYTTITPIQDIASAQWLATYRAPSSEVYATFGDVQVHPLTEYGILEEQAAKKLKPTTQQISNQDYVYLQYVNVVENIGLGYSNGLYVFDMSEVAQSYEDKNLIYSNQGSEIYK